MIHFRTAQINDAKLITNLVNSAYRGDYSRQGWTTEADLIEGQRTDDASIIKMIQSQGEQIEIALNSEEKVVGCVFLKQEDETTLYFGMLTVEPSLQGAGLGKKILLHIESIARKENKDKIRLTVIPLRKELIEFYERRGFKATGRLEDFPYDDPANGNPKISDLKLKEYIKTLDPS
jgi:ribosomal protein S18 acetylase RimI-like enzyme